VAPPSPSRLHCRFCFALLAAGLLVLLSTPARGQDGFPRPYVVDVELQTSEQLRQTLVRAEQLLVEGVASQEGDAAVTFVLHGPVIRDLLRENYLANKSMVDLAASLSAMGVISVKACRTWMGANQVDERQLQPFIETVSFGPGEVQRLVDEENYLYF
jgi:intracellular sulfur oxidation DsrE/DsrF family protein